MSLIPSDVGIRMRMQAEANLLQSVAPTREIPAELPDLQPGQTFTARLLDPLPENSFKALVAGQHLTLQLPEGSKAGDTVELVVVDRSGKVVIAKPVDTNTAANGGVTAYPFAKFSPAARMIADLLPAEGESTTSAALDRGSPLLGVAPQSQQDAQTLAGTLAKAVSQSGLFYEAHQAQWVSGQRPLTELLQEPQGQHSAPEAFRYAATEADVRAAAKEAIDANTSNNTSTNASSMPKVDADGTLDPPPRSTPADPIAHQAASESLRPLVQQQLEAASTQRMAWHGEVWPQQQMNLEIDWQNERDANGQETEEMRWGTSLSLTTPRLGRVDARLNLSSSGIQITLATPYGASAADLRDESPKLAEALAAAGIPLLALHIRHEDMPADVATQTQAAST